MADLFENPMGLMGFEFVEFASPQPGALEPVFEKLGFTLVAKHRSKDVVLFRQGDINFIVNREPKSLAGYFAAEHGPSACALAFRVRWKSWPSLMCSVTSTLRSPVIRWKLLT